jgi:hypothetical protein
MFLAWMWKCSWVSEEFSLHQMRLFTSRTLHYLLSGIGRDGEFISFIWNLYRSISGRIELNTCTLHVQRCGLPRCYLRYWFSMLAHCERLNADICVWFIANVRSWEILFEAIYLKKLLRSQLTWSLYPCIVWAMLMLSVIHAGLAEC